MPKVSYMPPISSRTAVQMITLAPEADYGSTPAGRMEDGFCLRIGFVIALCRGFHASPWILGCALGIFMCCI